MQMKNTFKHWIAIGLLAVGFLGANAQAQTAPAASGKTELLWLGQAGFRIKTPGGKIIVIDPWLTGGPKTRFSPHQKQADFVEQPRLTNSERSYGRQ